MSNARYGLRVRNGLVRGITEGLAGLTYILDFYPNSVAAYSIRKLRGAYTGPAIRVRRASDNTEQNIGFSGDDLNTSALTSFCTGTSGFVTTWYDQSGNSRDAVQPTAAIQPLIFSSGIITINSKPALRASSSSIFNVNTTLFQNVLVVSKLVSSNTLNYLTWGTSGGFYLDSAFAGQGFGAFDGTNLRGIGTNQTPPYQYRLNYGQRKGGNLFAAQNGNSEVNTGTIASTIETMNNILGRPGFNFGSGADIQEVIFYNTDQTANKSGLESNINTYYGIY